MLVADRVRARAHRRRHLRRVRLVRRGRSRPSASRRCRTPSAASPARSAGEHPDDARRSLADLRAARGAAPRRRSAPACSSGSGLLAVAIVAVVADQITKSLATRTHRPRRDRPAAAVLRPAPHQEHRHRVRPVHAAAVDRDAPDAWCAIAWMFVFFARSGARSPFFPPAVGLLAGGALLEPRRPRPRRRRDRLPAHPPLADLQPRRRLHRARRRPAPAGPRPARAQRRRDRGAGPRRPARRTARPVRRRASRASARAPPPSACWAAGRVLVDGEVRHKSFRVLPGMTVAVDADAAAAPVAARPRPGRAVPHRLRGRRAAGGRQAGGRGRAPGARAHRRHARARPAGRGHRRRRRRRPARASCTVSTATRPACWSSRSPSRCTPRSAADARPRHHPRLRRAGARPAGRPRRPHRGGDRPRPRQGADGGRRLGAAAGRHALPGRRAAADHDPARRHARHRPHAPDPRPPGGDRPPGRRRPVVLPRRAWSATACIASSCTPAGCGCRTRSRARTSRSRASCPTTSSRRSTALAAHSRRRRSGRARGRPVEPDAPRSPRGGHPPGATI